MANGDKYHGIDRLKRKLYRRGDYARQVGRTAMTSIRSDVGSSWQQADKINRPRKKRHNVLSKILSVAIVFFIATLIIAGVILVRGSNIVSVKNIELLIQGPVSVNAGEEMNLQIIVVNRNASALEFVSWSSLSE